MQFHCLLDNPEDDISHDLGGIDFFSQEEIGNIMRQFAGKIVFLPGVKELLVFDGDDSRNVFWGNFPDMNGRSDGIRICRWPGHNFVPRRTS